MNLSELAGCKRSLVGPLDSYPARQARVACHRCCGIDLWNLIWTRSRMSVEDAVDRRLPPALLQPRPEEYLRAGF